MRLLAVSSEGQLPLEISNGQIGRGCQRDCWLSHGFVRRDKICSNERTKVQPGSILARNTQFGDVVGGSEGQMRMSRFRVPERVVALIWCGGGIFAQMDALTVN